MTMERPLTVDDGLPPDRDAWPPGVLEALPDFAQGDVIADPPLFYFADPTRPVWARTYAYAAGSDGPEVVEAGSETRPAFAVITTQTCDIAEEDADIPVRPWVQASPVYDMADLRGDIRKLLRQGRGPRYLLHLPALPDGFWVADLRIEVPLEKGWLAGRKRLDGFGDEAMQRTVGDRLARLCRRPAFARAFVDAVQRPLVLALRELRKQHRDVYDRIDLGVAEVAVDLDSHLDPRQARLVLLTEEPLQPDLLDWWQTWWDKAASDAAEAGFTLHALDMRQMTEMTVAEYRRLTVVPLDRISPG